MINWSDFKIVGQELEYLIDAFESGWVSGGSYIEKLERALEEIFPGSTALSVSNGTSALQLAFQVLGVRPGDQVIVPSFCFQAAGNVLRQLGAIPVFCDVDTLSWNQTVQTIEAARTPQTTGVVVVHNYGVAAPIEAISRWAKSQGLWLIEDCAEAWFTRHAGRYVGQFGDIATFSMHATKTISCGEGGAVLINDPVLVRQARLLRSHGLDRTKAQYLHEIAGNNFRLSNLLAAVGFAQLEQREAIVAKQLANASEYQRRLFDHWAIKLQASYPASVDLPWAVAVSIWFDGLTIDRDQLIALLKQNGIDVRPGFYSASCLEYNDEVELIHSDVADRLHKTIIVLPCSLTLGRDEIGHVCDTLIDLIDRHRAVDDCKLVEARDVPDAQSQIAGFYARLGTGRTGFRYFDKRDFDVITRHRSTLLLQVGDKLIGYGHLDPEGDDLWLGIALADDATGQGWGKMLMQGLLEAAASLDASSLVLRVDRANERAIRLYRSFGFEPYAGSDTGASVAMRLER